MWRPHWASNLISAVVWLIEILGLLATGWIAVSTVVRGLPIHEVAFWTLGALAFALLASYYALRLGDYVEGYLADARIGRQVAEYLEELTAGGAQGTNLATATEIWADADPGPRTPLRWTVKLRRLKDAVARGELPVAEINGPTPNRETICLIADLVAFFRRSGWRTR
jgi:hypothetical protein